MFFYYTNLNLQMWRHSPHTDSAISTHTPKPSLKAKPHPLPPLILLPLLFVLPLPSNPPVTPSRPTALL